MLFLILLLQISGLVEVKTPGDCQRSHIGPREKLRWGVIILRWEVLHQMKVAG